MADFWKSNPRHYCDFCKCWIADNKPSRDFHERGKNHQRNVELRISEVRKKAFKDEKKKEEDSGYLRQMEEAAKKAFLKDLENDPRLARQCLQKIEEKKKAESEAASQEQAPSAKPKETKVSKGKGQGSSSEVKGQGSSSVVKGQVSRSEVCEEGGTWRLTHSPEGYPYYWNDVTGAVSWTLPEGAVFEESEAGETSQTAEGDTDEGAGGSGMSATTTSAKTDKTTKKTTSTSAKTTNAATTSTVAATASQHLTEESDFGPDSTAGAKEGKPEAGSSDTQQKERDTKVEASEFEVGDISCIPLPGEIPSSNAQPPPPGEIPMPSTIDPPPTAEVPSGSQEVTDAQEEEVEAGAAGKTLKRGHDSAYGQWETVPEHIEEPIDLQLPETKKNYEEKVITISEPKLKFREKKVDSLSAELVAFKKRKMNSRNLKQRQDT